MRPIDIAPVDLETVRCILREYAPGLEVRAFGSRVSWTARETSDLDVALLTEEPLGIARMTNLKAAFTKSYLPFRVDIVDWASTSENFRKVIEREHVVLVEHNSASKFRASKTKYLGDCVTINDSTYSPKEEYPFINYLNTGNITSNRISEIQYLHVGSDVVPSRARRKVQPGDIVYSTVRPIQRHYGLLKEVPENFLVSTGFCVIRGNPRIAETDFIYWFLTQHSVVEQLNTIAEQSTSAYPSIKPTDIEKLSIELPPLTEQRAIAHILGTLDDKIELNRRTNKTLEEMAQALFKSWFVDFEPVKAKLAVLVNGGTADEAERAAMCAISGKDEISLAKLQNEQPVAFASLAQTAAQFPSVMQNSQLGKIPKGWNLGCLNQVAIHLRNKTNPITTPNSLFQHFSIPAFDYDRLPRLEHGKMIKSQKSNVLPGVVLLSKLNPEIERVWLVDVESNAQAICSTEFLVLQPKPPFGRGYLYYLARSSRFRQEIQSLVTGTSKSHQRAPSETVLNIPVVLPSYQIADLFELRANGWLKSILLNFRVNKCLDSLRETILPKLISGELIVNSE